MRDELAVLPEYLGNHLLVTLVALALAVMLGVPLAVGLTRAPRLRGPVLAAVSVTQAIPGLALLALMVPVLATLAAAGVPVSAFGFLPTVIALTAYALLPIVRNGVTGILGVDAATVEAARALGMTDRQVLREVELPLALPVLVAGIRTAAVWTVGMATLATPVGWTCLGNYIFGGLQTRSWDAVLFGCAVAAALALALDGLLGLLERASARRSRWTALAAVGGLLGLLVPVVGPLDAGDDPILVGAKPFTEQYVLAAVLEQTLEGRGIEARAVEGLGSSIAFDALVAGELDVYVDYSGTLWANVLGRRDVAAADAVLTEVTRALQREHGVTVLGPLGFENAYALAVRRVDAEARGLATLADLRPHAPELVLGADQEFLDRPEWAAVRDTYGLDFAGQRRFDAAFLYEAVGRGEVDVISAYTSDGRVAAWDLVVLDDPRDALPPYDAVILLSSDAARDPRLRAALEPLLGAVDVDAMRRANQRVDADGDSPEAAARWLRAELGLP